ncbi:uncharacterized protein F5891DRAFT_1183703 [Suillus fuscotomentosus]|uniref:Uncharacterized protein n=1 Tax=Suillus fuscotomentosus TaxID=1912939 RepID=A0AAD4EF11_9AGAM|nr:uncharacterized protein F5891DRAFT_1183703 [Suillus fuscotomentosus]KAG1905034.1 hypothetical protein F5891DRAFT_1183703 [Suillus fuscotomentosus]
MPLDVSSVSMLEDVAIIDINNVSPSWNTYCFNLNINTPGMKKIVLRFKEPVTVPQLVPDTKDSEILSSGVSKTEEGLLKTEAKEARIEGGPKIKSEDDDFDCIPQTCIVSPCRTLTRQAQNPNPDPTDHFAPWQYIVRPFDAKNIPIEANK